MEGPAKVGIDIILFKRGPPKIRPRKGWRQRGDRPFRGVRREKNNSLRIHSKHTARISLHSLPLEELVQKDTEGGPSVFVKGS